MKVGKLSDYLDCRYGEKVLKETNQHLLRIPLADKKVPNQLLFIYSPESFPVKLILNFWLELQSLLQGYPKKKINS